MLAGRDRYGKLDWILPGLLEHAERVVFTGSERQHQDRVPDPVGLLPRRRPAPADRGAVADQGVRVLHIDCENNERQATRRYERIASIIDSYDPLAKDWQDRLHFEARPEGISIAGADRTWWESTCAAASPGVIVTGPVYQTGLATRTTSAMCWPSSRCSTRPATGTTPR